MPTLIPNPGESNVLAFPRGDIDALVFVGEVLDTVAILKARPAARGLLVDVVTTRGCSPGSAYLSSTRPDGRLTSCVMRRLHTFGLVESADPKIRGAHCDGYGSPYVEVTATPLGRAVAWRLVGEMLAHDARCAYASAAPRGSL